MRITCRGNIKQRDRLFDVIRSEQSMADTTVSRDPDSCVLKACTLGTMNAYVVDITGASVTADSSVSLIHRYCEKLPSDKYGNALLFPFAIHSCVFYNIIFHQILCMEAMHLVITGYCIK